MIIDCARCTVRGLACGGCAVTALVPDGPGGPDAVGRRAPDGAEAGHPYPSPPDLGPAELRALTVLANAGLIAPLRYAPRMARAG